MTRYTNLGRKRTYLEAGFEEEQPTPNAHPEGQITDGVEPVAESTSDVKPPKKKRKRSKAATKKKAPTDPDGVDGAPPHDDELQIKKKADARTKKQAKKEKFMQKRARDDAMRAAASEKRRMKRIHEKYADTTCFACRQKGHPASECPTTRPSTTGEGIPSKPQTVVGICYRCGSKHHTLARCRRLVDPFNPLPFASCFVCSGKGHLASSCPQNKERGVYPNGGSCKLCGETSHLAKDCGLRKQGNSASAVLVGVGREAGADEDDFHTFRRKKAEVEKEEHIIEFKVKRKYAVDTGAVSVASKSLVSTTAPAGGKKVVFF